ALTQIFCLEGVGLELDVTHKGHDFGAERHVGFRQWRWTSVHLTRWAKTPHRFGLDCEVASYTRLPLWERAAATSPSTDIVVGEGSLAFHHRHEARHVPCVAHAGDEKKYQRHGQDLEGLRHAPEHHDGSHRHCRVDRYRQECVGNPIFDCQLQV